MMRLLLWIIATAMMAITVHIAVVLWVPRLSDNQAYSVLWSLAENRQTIVLPEASQPIADTGSVPFRDPYLVIALCRFDIRNTPYSINGEITADFWSFSVHGADGIFQYGLTQAAMRDKAMKIELRNEAQVRARTLDPNRPVTDAIQVKLDVDEGLVVFTALAPQPSMRTALREALAKVRCAPLSNIDSGPALSRS